jgi:predicted nucleic acid-binding protein
VKGLYLDTSAVLRAVIETGTTPDIERAMKEADVLITSRLSLVESSRVLIRMRNTGTLSEHQIADAERDMYTLWDRCEIWELSKSVCEAARQVAPTQNLRALDALHLATYLFARKRFEALELLTADERLRRAARAIGV